MPIVYLLQIHLLPYFMIMLLLRSRYSLGEMYSLPFCLSQNISSPYSLIFVEFARELPINALCCSSFPHTRVASESSPTAGQCFNCYSGTARYLQLSRITSWTSSFSHASSK